MKIPIVRKLPNKSWARNSYWEMDEKSKTNPTWGVVGRARFFQRENPHLKVKLVQKMVPMYRIVSKPK